MFPIKDNVKHEIFPWATLGLILVNIYVFSQEITASNPDSFIKYFALIPSHVAFSNPVSLLPFVTAIFLHGGFLHILTNMWFFWVFGDNVEDHFGRISFIVLFFLAGIVGNVSQYFLDPHSSTAILGASGAISGILGAYLVLYPGAKIKSLIFIIVFITLIDVPAFIYLLYWFFLQVFSGATSFGNFQGGVAFWAHIGGFITGAVYAKVVKGRNKGYIEGEIVE